MTYSTPPKDVLRGNPPVADYPPVAKEVARLFDEAGEAIDAVDARVTSGLVAKATWSDLQGITPSENGTGGEVLATDIGTHFAASATGYDGSTVDNAGRYSWNSTWSRWVRIGDNGLSILRADVDDNIEAANEAREVKRIGTLEEIAGNNPLNSDRIYGLFDPLPDDMQVIPKRWRFELSAPDDVYFGYYSRATGLPIRLTLVPSSDTVSGWNEIDLKTLDPFYRPGSNDIPGLLSGRMVVDSGQRPQGQGYLTRATGNTSTGFSNTNQPNTSNQQDWMAYFEYEVNQSDLRSAKVGLLGGERLIDLSSLSDKFRWHNNYFDIGLNQSGDGFVTSWNPYYWRFFGASTADAAYYVDAATGDDTNAGTLVAPFATLYKALHNQTAQGDLYVGLLGDLDEASNGIGATITARNLVIEPVGSKSVTVSTRLGMGAWALVGGTTATYESTADSGTPAHIVDRGVPTPHSHAARLVPGVPDGDGEMIAGQYRITSGTVRLRTADSRAPDASIRVLADSGNHIEITQTGSSWTALWCDGVNFEGGRAFDIGNPSPRALISFSNCWLGHGTDDDLFYNYGRSSVVLYNVDFVDSHRDAAGHGNLSRFAEIDCKFYDVGRNGANNDQASTSHDDCCGVRLSSSPGRGYYSTSPASDTILDVGESTIFNGGISVEQSTDGGRAAVGSGNDADVTLSYNALVTVVDISSGGSAFSTDTGGKVFVWRVDRAGLSDGESSDVTAFDLLT